MIPDLTFGGLALGSALFGVVVALWSRVKALAWRVANLLVAQIVVTGDAEAAVSAYLWKHGRRSRFGERRFGGAVHYVRPVGRRLSAVFEQISTDAAVYWVGRVPVVARYDHRSIGGNHAETLLTVTYLRGTLACEALLRAANAEFNALHHSGERGSRYSVERLIGTGGRDTRSDPESARGVPIGAADAAKSVRFIDWAADQLGEPLPASPFEFLAFPPEGEAVVADVGWWIDNEAEYKSRGVPWRMGVCLAGPPGTGKSSLARGVAQQFGLPLYAVELATMTDRDLIRAWQRARNDAPAVVLIEDVDTVFEGRKVVESGPEGLTFGCLLNCLSGAESADGVLVFVTTNRPDTLDPALGVPTSPGSDVSTRPGRIDKVVTLGPLTPDCRERVAAKVLAGYPAEAAEAVARGAGMTGAQFQQLCVEKAFELIRARRLAAQPATVA